MNTVTPSKTPVVILVRVSTIKQDTERQVHELTRYADEQGYQVLEVIEESISGNADKNSRTGLQTALDLARTGKIKKVLVHEVSRIARRNSIAHEFIEELEDLGVSVYWHTQRIETLLPSGKRNPASSLIFALLAEMARNERDTLRERILSGLDAAKRKGKVLGRPMGSKTPVVEMLDKHADIIRHLKKGKSIRDISKIVNKGISTVQRVKKIHLTNSLSS